MILPVSSGRYDTSGVLCPLLGSPVWETWTYFSKSSKWLKFIERWDCVSSEVRLGKLVFFSLEKIKPQEKCYQCVCSHTEIQKISFKCNYFTVRLVKYLGQMTQRDFEVSVLEEDDHSLTRHEPEQLDLIPCCIRKYPESHSNVDCFVILCFC